MLTFSVYQTESGQESHTLALKQNHIVFSHGLLCKTWIVPPLGVNDLVIYIYIYIDIYLFSSLTFREKRYSSDSSEPI